jgi:hypothetical protein
MGADDEVIGLVVLAPLDADALLPEANSIGSPKPVSTSPLK